MTHDERPASWEPYGEERPGALIMIQHVGYDGALPGSLLWVAPGASLGGYLKRHRELVTKHTPSWYEQTKEWRTFLEKHRLPYDADGDDEPTGEQIFASLQLESDELVLRVLSEYRDNKDDEGHYVQRVIVKETDFFGLEPGARQAYFAPVQRGEATLYQCVCSQHYGWSRSIFLRAKSHGDALRTIVERRDEESLRGAFDLLCRVERTAGNLPEDPDQRESFLLAASADELASAFEFGYSKNGTFRSISLHEAAPPWLVA